MSDPTDDDDADDTLSPWPKQALTATVGAEPHGGAEYAALHAAHRLLNDRLAGASLPPDVACDVQARLTELTALLAEHQVPESERIDGWRPDLPGRGQALLPPFVIDEETMTDTSADTASDDSDARGPVSTVSTMRGRVTFTRFHLGGGAAVHGGVQPLMFDDIMGRAANYGLLSRARTAYLKVDYRQITPLDVELYWEVTLERIEGRKRFITGRLTDARGVLLADADSLYVELLPGQP